MEKNFTGSIIAITDQLNAENEDFYTDVSQTIYLGVGAEGVAEFTIVYTTEPRPEGAPPLQEYKYIDCSAQDYVGESDALKEKYITKVVGFTEYYTDENRTTAIVLTEVKKDASVEG